MPRAFQVGQCRGFELATRNQNKIVDRQHKPEPLIVDKDKNLVFPDWPTQGSSILICVHEGPRYDRSSRWHVLIKPVVCIQHSSVPPILSIPMKIVRSRLCDVIDAGPSEAAILPRISVVDNGHLLDFVITQKQIRGAGIVDQETR